MDVIIISGLILHVVGDTNIAVFCDESIPLNPSSNMFMKAIKEMYKRISKHTWASSQSHNDTRDSVQTDYVAHD